MATSTANALPLGNYAASSYSLPSTAIPDDVRAIGFRIARCTSQDPTVWPSAGVQLAVRLEFSPDGGASWFPWGAYTAGGGIIARNGVELAFGSIEQSVPLGTNRRLRGTAVVSGGTLRSSVDVTLTT